MRRAAHPQIDFHRGHIPMIRCRVSPGEKIDRQSADNALLRERLSDPKAEFLNGDPVFIFRRKETSEVHLACRSAEDLFVRGSEDDLAAWVDAQLYAWRPHLFG